ncbi:MAG: prolyl oligopeptidase family serine peptidase [Deltaproteobacteria bacterium]|nr:prolyl oligopeptidase family serine peptidase [Deltaproteobacteria bacterium]
MKRLKSAGLGAEWLPLFLLLFLVVGGGRPATGKSQDTMPTHRDLFLVKPRVMQVALSPEGNGVAFLLREPYGASLWVLNSRTGEKIRRLESKQVKRFDWATGGSGLFLETEDQVAFLPRGSGRPSLMWRQDLAREEEYRGVDPILPAHILVTQKFDEADFRLLRIDRFGNSVVLFRSDLPIHSFVLDRLGRVAYLTGVDGVELVVHRPKAIDPPKGLGEEIFRCSLLNACGLLAVEPDINRLWLQHRPDGDRWKLTTLEPKTGKVSVFHEDPLRFADLEEVRFDPTSGRPLLAYYDTESRRNYGLTEAVSRHLRELEGILPDGGLEVEPRGTEHRFWLVSQNLPTHQHRRFFIYDTELRQAKPILEQERLSSPGLPADLAVPKRSLSYVAEDGRRVYGFLSVPRDVDLGKAPMVARIHGGPWNHVRQGFDPITQFLVSRGYIVFEPNFRASTGYGLKYMLAAKGEFGDGQVHRDIVDGVHFLLDQGIGNPQRVGIMGHSFGGFSALGGVAFSPELFQAGLASAPAIDLLRSLEDVAASNHKLSNGLSQMEVLWHLVVDRDDPAAVEKLRRNSPEARLADTARPLLMVAGARDEKIALVDVQHYALALDGLGKDVSLLVDEQAGHSFESPLLREAYLFLVERFFGEHLGGRRQMESRPRLEDYLEESLAIRGKSLASRPQGTS